jgi:cell division protein FtsB
MIAAESLSNTPDGLETWLRCLAWFMGFMCAGAGFLKLVRGKPASPPNEQLEQTNSHLRERVEKLEKQIVDADADCARGVAAVEQKLAHEVKEIREAIHRNHDKAMEVASIRGKTIYEKMDNLRSDMEDRLGKVEESIESMPERIVSLFKNIKELGKP